MSRSKNNDSSSPDIFLPPAPHSTPGRRRRPSSAPNSPVPPTARSTRQQPRRGKSMPRKRPSRRLVFLSPRVGLSDADIFPQDSETWKDGEQRWKYVSEQAGVHRQDGSVLRVPHRRRVTPAALQVGMPSGAAARVKTVYLPVEPNNKELKHDEDHCGKGLPEWLDVVTSKFPNLQHLYLIENETDSKKEVEPSESDTEDELLTPSKSLRLRRLYVLYRLPDLLSIDGNPVTQQERQLARPAGPNGEKVARDEWVDSSLVDALENKLDRLMDTPNSKSVAERDAVEVCLSGSIKMIDVQGTKNELVERVRMPLLDDDDDDEKKEEKYTAPQELLRQQRDDMDPLGDLDKYEYVSVESSAHCDWGVACGSLSLPYFRPTDNARRLKNSAENSKSRFRISIRQRRDENDEQTVQKQVPPKSPNGKTSGSASSQKVEKRLAAGGRRMHDVDDRDTTEKKTRRRPNEKESSGLTISPRPSYSENGVQNKQAHSKLEKPTKSSGQCAEESATSNTTTATSKKAERRFVVGEKRDNYLLLLENIEQARSPRIQIGLIEHVQTSPRTKSVTGVEVTLSSPTRGQPQGSQPLRRHSSSDVEFSLKKLEHLTQKVEKKLASGGRRSESALLEARHDAVEVSRVRKSDYPPSASDANGSVRLDLSIAGSPPRPVGSRSPSTQITYDLHRSLSCPLKSAENFAGKTPLMSGSPSRRIPASKSLTSPFPMQFRSRSAKPLSPPRVDVLPNQEKSAAAPLPHEHTTAASPQRNLKITVEINDQGLIQDDPSPPPAPRERSPTLSTINSVQTSSPIPLVRVQSSPSKLGRRALFGDLPPPCPGDRQRVLAPSPPRRSTRPMRKNLVKWRQQQTARSTSIIDNEEEDEFSSDEENLELD